MHHPVEQPVSNGSGSTKLEVLVAGLSCWEGYGSSCLLVCLPGTGLSTGWGESYFAPVSGHAVYATYVIRGRCGRPILHRGITRCCNLIPPERLCPTKITGVRLLMLQRRLHFILTCLLPATNRELGYIHQRKDLFRLLELHE